MMSGSFSASTTGRRPETSALNTLLSREENLLSTTDILLASVWDQVTRRSRQYRQLVLEDPDRFDELVETDDNFPEELELLLRCEERLESLFEGIRHNSHQLLVKLTQLLLTSSMDNGDYQTLSLEQTAQLELIQQLEKTYVTLVWVMNKGIGSNAAQPQELFKGIAQIDGSTVIITNNNEKCIQGGLCQVTGCLEPIFAASTHVFLCYDHWVPPQRLLLSAENIETTETGRTPSIPDCCQRSRRKLPSTVKIIIERSQGLVLKANRIIGVLLEQIPQLALDVAARDEGLIFVKRVNDLLNDIIENFWELRGMKESEADVKFRDINERRAQLSKLSRGLIDIVRRLDVLREYLAGGKSCQVNGNGEGPRSCEPTIESMEALDLPLAAMPMIKRLGKHVINTCEMHRQDALRRGIRTLQTIILGQMIERDGNAELSMNDVIQGCTLTFDLPNKICMANGCWKYVGEDSSPREQFCDKHHQTGASTNSAELNTSFGIVEEICSGRQLENCQPGRAVEYFGKYMVTIKYLSTPGWPVGARCVIDDDNDLIVRTVLGGVTSVRVQGQICLVDECLRKACSLSESDPAARCFYHLIYRDTANLLFDQLDEWSKNIAAGIHNRAYKLMEEINIITQRLPPDLTEDTEKPFRKSPRRNESAVEPCNDLSDGGQKLLKFLSGKRLIFLLLVLNYRKEHEQIIFDDDMYIRLNAINKAFYQFQSDRQDISWCPELSIPYYTSQEQKHRESPDQIYIFLAKYGRLSKLIDITDPNFKIYILVINMLETILIIENDKRSISEKDLFTFVEFHSLCESIPDITCEKLFGKSVDEEKVDLGAAIARPVEFIHPQITVRDVLVEYVHLAARAGKYKDALSIITVLHDNLATPILQIVLEMAAVCLSCHSPDCHVPDRIKTSLASRQTQKDANDGATAKRRPASTTKSVSPYVSRDDTVETDVVSPESEMTESPPLTGLIEEKKTELIAAVTRSIFLQGLHEIVDNTENDLLLQQQLHDYISRNGRFADMAQTATITGTIEFAYKNWQTDLSFMALLDQFPDFTEQRNVNKKQWDTRTFSELYSNLHPEIQTFLREASGGKWNFIQEPNQYGECDFINDLDTLLVSPSNRSGISQRDLMFECLELAIQEDMGRITIAIALLVYKSIQTNLVFPWSCTDVYFLRKITQYKSEDISQHTCDLLMCYAEKLDEEGDNIFSDVILRELLTEVDQYLTLWPRVPPVACKYKSADQARIVAARCLAARADTARELGCYKDAVCDLVGALEFISISQTPEHHLEAECLDILIEIIGKLSTNEYTQLEKKVSITSSVDDENDLISMAIAFNERARKLTSPGNPLYFIRYVKTTALRYDLLQRSGTEHEQSTQSFTRGDAARSLRYFKMPATSSSKQAKRTLLALVDLYYLVYMCDTSEVSLLELAKNVYHHVHRGTLAILTDNNNATAIPPDMAARIQETNETLLHFLVPDESDVISHLDTPRLVEGNALQLIRTNKKKRKAPCTVTTLSRPMRQQCNDLTLSIFTDTKKEYVAGAWLVSGSRYVSTLPCDVGTVQGCCAPIHFSKPAADPADVMDRYSSHHREQIGLYDAVYEARVWNFKVAANVWHHRKALICFTTQIPLDITQCTPGSSRFPVNLQLLSQGYSTRPYVGKFYKNPSLRGSSIIEVVAHEIARQYLALFMEELEKRCPDYLTKIRMLPAQHVHVYGKDGIILDILNVEPLVTPTGFTKITNNGLYVHPDLDSDLLLAFSHFTWSRSEGKLMVTDLQGWLPLDKRGFVILTDPLLHTVGHPVLSKLTGNRAEGGFKSFWTAQHQSCSDICHSLELDRDPQYP